MYRVKFVSYDGKYPNLCSGTLVLNVDGKDVVFPDNCLSSGGSVYADDDGDWVADRGEWSITEFPEGFPEELKQDAVSIVNDNVIEGCCGVCI